MCCHYVDIPYGAISPACECAAGVHGNSLKVTSRLEAYRRIENKAEIHASEICGISDSGLSDEIDSHTVQPQFCGSAV